MKTLPVPRLAALLRDHARGVYATEAATDLLISHERWLQRPDFLAACVWVSPDDGDTYGPPVWFDETDPPTAHVDVYTDRDDPPTTVAPEDITSAGISWRHVSPFLAAGVAWSGSEERILRLATDLAGTTTGVPLAELLSGLDDRNSALVLDAIAHVLRHPRTPARSGAASDADLSLRQTTSVATPLEIVAEALRVEGVAETSGELLAEAGHALSELRSAGWRIVRTDDSGRVTAEWHGVGRRPGRRAPDGGREI